MSSHAILSPSAAHRWLNCTPSARLEESFPDKAGSYAEEGTLAHRLGEAILKMRLKLVNLKDHNKELLLIEKQPMYDHAMAEHAEGYAVFVMERFSEAQTRTKDAQIFLEQRLNLTDYIPEGFGTGDAIIIADGILDAIDLKYGKGVPVSAEGNRQMMLYALGALKEFDLLYDIDTVRMTIHQPRIDNYSSWEMPVKDLKQWAQDELIPRAQLAFAGEGVFAAGDHCRFCKAKAVCRHFAEMNLEVARYDFKDAALLDDSDIADILTRADIFQNWLSSVQDYALDQAVNHNKKWPGFKLVEGRSNRKYADEAKVAQKLLGVGFAEDLIYTKSLIGITALEKGIGKKEFNTHLADLVVKPPGKPTLVPESDKRPEYNSAECAKQDFATI